MQELDFKTLIISIGNDLKIAIDNLTGTIINIHEDVENLKRHPILIKLEIRIVDTNPDSRKSF